MSKRIISTPHAPAAIGPYSQAVAIPASAELVFCSGQVPIDPRDQTRVTGPVADQTRACMLNVQAVLGAAGSDWDKVVKTTIYLQDMADYPEVNAAYAEFFPGAPPARSAVQVAGLPLGVAVEIEVIAFR